MGAVKFDLTTKEKIFKDISFSSAEDIYDILWMLDAIIDGYKDMNVEAIATKIDFYNLLEKVDDEVLSEYVAIQDGSKPMKNEDYNLEVPEVIAKRLSISLNECEERLMDAIELMIAGEYRQWYINYLDNYKDKYVEEKKKTKHLLSDLDGWKDIDYKKKYMWKNNIQPKDEYPHVLNELLDYRNKNNTMIQRLEHGNKDNKQKLKWHYRERIRIDEDISEVKRSFNIEMAKTNWKGRTENKKSFDDDLDYVDNNNWYADFVYDSLSYNKILKTANEYLTDKQRVVFYLHFENQLQQSEIAEILDDDQGNISRVIQKIIEKIQKSL